MSRTQLIAEIGWNHMGDMNLAKEMIMEAAKSGADICKFQTWSEKRLKPGPWDNDGRRKIYKQAQLSYDNHYLLKEICDANNVIFLTSVFNIKDLDFLKDLKINMIKIPSHEVNNIELIDRASRLFQKILVSTGAAKWNEVKNIAETIGHEKLILMHCVSAYPCSAKNINLPRINSLKKLTREVGFSGHYPGIDDAIAAISFGVNYIEKHFTIGRDLPGRDNRCAILPEEFRLIASFRDNFALMNIKRGLDLQESEMDVYMNYRGRWSKED